MDFDDLLQEMERSRWDYRMPQDLQGLLLDRLLASLRGGGRNKSRPETGPTAEIGKKRIRTG